MKKYKFTINGNQYDTEILSIEDGNAEVVVNGIKYSVEVEQGLVAPKTPKLVRSISVPSTDVHPSISKTRNPTLPKGAGTIQSPLPGTVVRIFVAEGEEVKIGQRLLILEAMKMENNIESDKSGKIISILKNEGESVIEGDVLITIA